MTRPTTLPRWSTDHSNETAPSSGQQDTGWTPNQMAVSDYYNWLARWTYDHLFYLDDRLHAAQTAVIPAVAGNGDGAIFTEPGRVEALATDVALDFFIPIVLPAGSRVTNWLLRCRDASGVSFSAQAYRLGNDGTLTAHSNSDTSTGSGADQDLTPSTFAAYTVVSTEGFGVRVLAGSGGTGSNHRFLYLTVTYDRPEL